MTVIRPTIAVFCLIAIGACTEEPPPRSVDQFLDKPILLEAALVRCTQNRAETRYDAECVNAREAVKIIEAKEEAERRADLEAESLRKREALRRTQRAAAEARRRAEEQRRLREEAEYLAQFGELPPSDSQTQAEPGNVPQAVIPEPVPQQTDTSNISSEVVLPTAGSNAPVVEAAPEEEAPRDLDSIRDELRRRAEEDGN